MVTTSPSRVCFKTYLFCGTSVLRAMGPFVLRHLMMPLFIEIQRSLSAIRLSTQTYRPRWFGHISSSVAVWACFSVSHLPPISAANLHLSPKLQPMWIQRERCSNKGGNLLEKLEELFRTTERNMGGDSAEISVKWPSNSGRYSLRAFALSGAARSSLAVDFVRSHAFPENTWNRRQSSQAVVQRYR